jgi:NAD(P)-dependent dehydrogenase (short-subunit alcohol dehydrogenase family)
MASKIVAVAGGSGKLGRAIVDELVANGSYKVFVLGREVCHDLQSSL